MRRFTMLASLLMVLCLQMAAQTWEDVKVGTSTRKTLTYVPKNVEKSPALVISLHGFFSNFGTFMYLSLRRPLSAKEKSMLFHP